MSCKYCEPNGDDKESGVCIGMIRVPCGYLGTLLVDLWLEDDQLSLFACENDGGMGMSENIKINYCPMCGRKVRK